MSSKSRTPTENLTASLEGDDQATADLVQEIYEDLKPLAIHFMRGERPNHTLQPTALIGEAYLRLVDRKSPWEGRTHFIRVAAQTMRRVLVDHARGKDRQKRIPRGKQCSIFEEDAVQIEDPVFVIALNEAVEELAKVNERMASIFDLRFFGGLTRKETAAELGVSEDVVRRDWRFVKTWMNQRFVDAES